MSALILSGLVGFIIGMVAWTVFGAPLAVCLALYLVPTVLTLAAMVFRHFLVVPERQIPLHQI